MTKNKEQSTFSGEQFRAHVLGLDPATAVFDCDGTLWDGDAGLGFMNWSLEQELVSPSMRKWIESRHRAYRSGDVSEIAICGEMVQVYAGLRESDFRSAVAAYVREFVTPRIFPELADLIADLRVRGTSLWAVSSTNKWLIAEGLRAFGIPEERVLAAETAVVDGVITGEIVDVPTDDAKAAALRRIGLSGPDAVFGNSIHDLAMLEIAAHPFPVNPTAGLAEAAAERGWRVFHPAGATTPSMDVTGE